LSYHNPLNDLNPQAALRTAIDAQHPKSASRQTMENTMDKDYELPIPMHRSFITLDPRFDTPLPFRHRLKQVTKLTTENSTPYQVSKARRLSRFEQLPFEVREQIYHHIFSLSGPLLGPQRPPMDMKRPLGHTLHCAWDVSLWYNFDPLHEMFRVNRNLRQELLDILFEKTAVSFDYPLSDRRIFYDNWHNVNAMQRFQFGLSVQHFAFAR
jgi:hypothetical protein